MKTFDLTLSGETYPACVLTTPGRFASGQPAFELVNDEGPVTRINVELPLAPESGCIWVKDWSENEGLLRQLIEWGLVTPTGRVQPTGFVAAVEARLTAEALEVLS